MKKIAIMIALLVLGSSCYAQVNPPIFNPFLPPPVVPGFEACQNFFDTFISCQPGWVNQGQPQCPAVDREYYEVLRCPEVNRRQARVNARAEAGLPPMPEDLNALIEEEKAKNLQGK